VFGVQQVTDTLPAGRASMNAPFKPLGEDKNIIDSELCRDGGKCIGSCPMEAIVAPE